MNSKIVFFDIDGTLWDDKMIIPDSTRTAINLLKANGHKVFICSGRSRSNINSPELLGLGFDGIVAACGNHVEYHDEVIYEKLLSTELVKKIIEVCEANHMPMVLEGPKNHWISERGFEQDPFIEYLWQSMGDAAKPLRSYEEGMILNKFSADILPDTNFPVIEAALKDDLDILMHTDTIIELIPKGTSKATGIEWVCNYLGIAKEDTYAVGDSVNDLDMLAYVAHGIAMGNSTARPREIAEYITSDIHEDGIYNAMKHYGLI